MQYIILCACVPACVCVCVCVYVCGEGGVNMIIINITKNNFLYDTNTILFKYNQGK